MTLYDFLNKETPSYGGCMLCLAKYKRRDWNPDKKEEVDELREEWMLVERVKISNGDMFTVNTRFFYDFEFAWDEKNPWEIRYKAEFKK